MSKGKMIRNVFTGTAVLLLAGFIYAWSVLSYPIAQTYPQWAGGALGLAFTLCMAFFCLGGLLGGLTGNRISLGLRLLCSGVFLAAGFFLSAAARQPWMLVAGYGILCGTGSGLAYNGVISFGNRCFPEKSRGLLLGILLMGFGAGGFLFGSAYTALTPAGEGWRQSLRVVGLLSFGVLGIGARLLREEKTGDEQRRAHPGGYTPGQMLKTPAFWLFFLWQVLVLAGGLGVISQAKSMTLFTVVALSPGAVSLIVGLLSLCNGAGRILFGRLYDKRGWKKAMLPVSLCAVLGSLAVLGALLASSMILLCLGFALIGLSYGGVAPMVAAVIREFFGEKRYNVNLQLSVMNLLPASLGGTAAAFLAGGRFGYYLIGGMALLCGLLSFPLLLLLKKPAPQEALSLAQAPVYGGSQQQQN